MVQEIKLFDIVSICQGAGAYKFFFITQMIVPGSSYWNMGFGLEPGAVERDEEAKGTMVTLGQNMAWLNLAEPWVGDAAAILREKGYFWGGVLPRWFDTDGLLM